MTWLSVQSLGCGCRLLPPSPPSQQTTAREDEAGKSRTGDGAGHCGHGGQLTSNFARGVTRRMNIKITLPAQHSRDQRRFGRRGRPAVGRDEGRIVTRSHRKIEDWGDVAPSGHS